MTDRELLELAAKASDLKVISYSEGYGLGIEGDGVWWNPIKNDGHALRLAGALNLSIDIAGPTTSVYRHDIDGCTESNAEDRMSATRRAIVGAAAMVGKWM